MVGLKSQLLEKSSFVSQRDVLISQSSLRKPELLGEVKALHAFKRSARGESSGRARAIKGQWRQFAWRKTKDICGQVNKTGREWRQKMGEKRRMHVCED